MGRPYFRSRDRAPKEAMKRSKSEIDAFLNAKADEMRRNPTEAEAALWIELDSRWHFLFQYPQTGTTKNGGRWSYILDACHLETGLCIEVDGSSHRNRKGRDRRRDTRLATIGIRTIRFTNKDVLKDIESVLAKIRTALES